MFCRCTTLACSLPGVLLVLAGLRCRSPRSRRAAAAARRPRRRSACSGRGRPRRSESRRRRHADRPLRQPHGDLDLAEPGLGVGNDDEGVELVGHHLLRCGPTVGRRPHTGGDACGRPPTKTRANPSTASRQAVNRHLQNLECGVYVGHVVARDAGTGGPPRGARRRHRLDSFEVGERPRDPQEPVVRRGRSGPAGPSPRASRRAPVRVGRATVAAARAPSGRRCATPSGLAARSAWRARAACTRAPRPPPRPRPAGPSSPRRCSARHLDLEVDAVEQRARDPRAGSARTGAGVQRAGADRGRPGRRRGTGSWPPRAGSARAGAGSPRTRAMVTARSSSGWRSASRTLRRNSGSSSRKRTPLWARLTSPGPRARSRRRRAAASLAVWCGLRNGPLARAARRAARPRRSGWRSSPAPPSGESGGRMPGQAARQHGLARARAGRRAGGCGRRRRRSRARGARAAWPRTSAMSGSARRAATRGTRARGGGRAARPRQRSRPPRAAMPTG